MKCELRGVHYLGTTSQGQKVCLTISADERWLRQYAFGTRFKCSDGSHPPGVTQVGQVFDIAIEESHIFAIGNGKGLNITAVGKSGRFSDGLDSEAYSSTFSGRVQGGAAPGSLHQRFKPGAQSAGGTCSTGTVRWSARRLGR